MSHPGIVRNIVVSYTVQEATFGPVWPCDEPASDEVTQNRPGTSELPPQSLRSPAEAAADEIDRDIELTDEEKLVIKLLHEQSPVDLNELKGKTGLSNKKWDTAIKGLGK